MSAVPEPSSSLLAVARRLQKLSTIEVDADQLARVKLAILQALTTAVRDTDNHPCNPSDMPARG